MHDKFNCIPKFTRDSRMPWRAKVYAMIIRVARLLLMTSNQLRGHSAQKFFLSQLDRDVATASRRSDERQRKRMKKHERFTDRTGSGGYIYDAWNITFVIYFQPIAVRRCHDERRAVAISLSPRAKSFPFPLNITDQRDRKACGSGRRKIEVLLYL